MKAFIVLCLFVGVAVAQEIYQPIPYNFKYDAPSEDGGSSSHTENGDGAGHVSGSYTLNNLEGHSRTVEYVADEGGFRATVRTNEPGTTNMNSADVAMDSSSAEINPISYALGINSVPAARAVGPSARIISSEARMISPMTPPSTGRPGVRYVLVPVTDPRARGYTR